MYESFRRENERYFEAPVLSGACLLVSAEAFYAVGGFCEEYFFNVEDIDLSCRLRWAGGRTVVDRSFAVVHERGHSSSVPEEARILEAVRAMLTFFALHRTRRETAAAGLAMIVGCALRGLIRFAAGRTSYRVRLASACLPQAQRRLHRGCPRPRRLLRRDPSTDVPMSPAAASRRLRTDAYTMLGASVVARGGLLLTQILTARILGIDDFNLFVTASVVGSIIYTISDLGSRRLPSSAPMVTPGSRPVQRGSSGVSDRSRSGLRPCSACWSSPLSSAPLPARSSPAAMAILLTYSIQSLSYFWRTPLLAATQVLRESRIMVAERTLSVIAGILALVVFESLVLMALASSRRRRARAADVSP